MKYPLKASICIAAIFSSCQYDPRAYEYTTSKPMQSIAGSYMLTDGTMRFLKEKQYEVRPSFIELRSDSTFIIENIPDLWNAFEEPTGKFESVFGRWAIGKHQQWWAVKLIVDSTLVSGAKSYKKTRFGTQAMLIGESQPYILNFGIGDPDTGEAIRYNQKQNLR